MKNFDFSTAHDPDTKWTCSLVVFGEMCGYEFYRGEAHLPDCWNARLFCTFEDLQRALFPDERDRPTKNLLMFTAMELLRRYINKGTEWEQSIPFEPVETGIERYFREQEEKESE